MKEEINGQEEYYSPSSWDSTQKKISYFVKYAGLVAGVTGIVDQNFIPIAIGAAAYIAGSSWKDEIENFINQKNFENLEKKLLNKKQENKK